MSQTNRRKKDFYTELMYIHYNWSPLMRRALGVPKSHIKSLIKTYEKYAWAK